MEVKNYDIILITFVILNVFGVVRVGASNKRSNGKCDNMENAGENYKTIRNEEETIQNLEKTHRTWLEIQKQAKGHNTSSTAMTRKFSEAKILRELIAEITLCYNCVGLNMEGNRYGCTEEIHPRDITQKRPGGREIFVRCKGACMFSQTRKNGSVIFVRSCSPQTCVGNEMCSHGDGTCAFCCETDFCNRVYPSKFLQKTLSNNNSSVVMATKQTNLIVMVLLMLLASYPR